MHQKIQVFRPPSVYHVGALNGSGENAPYHGGYEGDAISVSLCPDAWIGIARLGDAPVWRFDNQDSAFLDIPGKNSDFTESVLRWAEINDLIKRVERWAVCWFDDEIEDELFFELDSYEDALDEAGGNSDSIQFVKGLEATEKLVEHHQSAKNAPTVMVRDFALMVWAEGAGFDGVWWCENYDPSALSAPRGGIFESRLDRFNAVAVDNTPSDEDLLQSQPTPEEIEMSLNEIMDTSPRPVESEYTAKGTKL